MSISFRPLRRSDLPLLQRWLSEPHVDRWWHQPFGLEELCAKYAPRIDGTEPTHVHLIDYSNHPIGWIQWYRWADYPTHAAQLGAEPSTAGIDLAIGERDMIGRGLGPEVILGFLEGFVFVDRTITACVSDPEEQNVRSIRAFEKAGFVAVRSIDVDQTIRRVVRLGRARTSRKP